LNLITGDGVPTDRKAGLEWVVKAAEAGAPLAARYVENKLQNGENIEIDETRMATALKRQADGGDVESMRVLAPMMIRGRGVAQDPQAGIALLLEAAGQGTGGDIEYQIGDLYLIGTNGLPANHEEGMKWYAISAGRGNIRAMATLAGLWENEPMMDMRKLMETGRIPKKTFERDIVQSYCWRMRASLMGDALAHYELALMRSRRNSDSHGNVIEPDLIQADFWFRLGVAQARFRADEGHPDHDSRQRDADLPADDVGFRRLLYGLRPWARRLGEFTSSEMRDGLTFVDGNCSSVESLAAKAGQVVFPIKPRIVPLLIGMFDGLDFRRTCDPGRAACTGAQTSQAVQGESGLILQQGN
jgi:TPR repeat protein